jgi:hypothetical protein
MTCYIFIAYIANIASPFFNFAPYLTKTFEIVPGIGVIAFFALLSSNFFYFLLSDSNLTPIESPLESNKCMLLLLSEKNYTVRTSPLIVIFN